MNSHETTDGIIAGLAARIACELALIDVFAVVTVSGQDVTDLARALFLPSCCRDAELLALRARWARMHRWAVLFVLALQAVLVAIANVLLADAVVLSTLP